MMSLGLRTPWLAAAAVILSAAAAAADPIQIASGSLQWRSNVTTIPITLTGEGFTFSGATNRAEGVFMPVEQCGVPECVAGATVDLRAYFLGHALSGTATIEGTTYTAVGSLAGTSSLLAEWTGALPIPAGFSGGTLVAPFQFDGEFAFETDPTQSWRSVNLVGSGTAVLTFSAWPSGQFPGALSLDAVTYAFEPAAATPEPASLLLMGTGLCALAAARRRRSHTQA